MNEAQSVQTPAPQPTDRTTAPFYALLPQGSTVYVKEGEFFRSQGGLQDGWGRAWTPINAADLADAYVVARKLSAERVPHGPAAA